MSLKKFTITMGIIFLAMGILAFMPGITTYPRAEDPGLALSMAHGRLFGLFPVNALHNLIHIVFGVWALAVYKNMANARLYCKATAIVYAVLAVFGLFPTLNVMFGLAPLHGNNIWLHALIAIATGYYGFVWGTSPKTSGRWA